MPTPVRPAPPMRRHARHLLALMLPILILSGASAQASGDQVVADCVAGKLHPPYSAAEYRDALANLPADVAEYTGCAAQISAAQLRQRGQGSAAAPYAGHSVAQSFGRTRSTSALPDGAAAGSAPSALDAQPTSPAPGQPAVQTGAVDGPSTLLVSDGGAGLAAEPDTAGSAPKLPIVIALSVIILSLTRALTLWGRRTESLAATKTGAGTA